MPRLRLAKDGDRSVAPLDDISKAIIEQLQRDGRMPYATIGLAVGLSEAAVRHRVQRLIDAGVMQVVAVTNPLQVGFPRAAMIGITVEGDLEAVASQVEALPEVDYLVICAGGFDLMAEVVAEDDDHLLEILNRRIRPIPGVRRTETFVYLQLRKQIYTWGTRLPSAHSSSPNPVMTAWHLQPNVTSGCTSPDTPPTRPVRDTYRSS